MTSTLRSLAKRPVFSLTVIATLAFGLGLVSAILSLLYEVQVRPLPFPEPERLTSVWARNESQGWLRASASLPELRDLQQRSPAFAHISPFIADRDFTLATDGRPPVTAETAFIGERYLSLQGAPLVAGRFFSAEECREGSGATLAVVHHRFWQEKLGGRTDVVGSTVRLNNRVFTIVGVLGENYRDLTERWVRTELFIPLSQAHLLYGDAVYTTRGGRQFTGLTQLAPGVTLTAAQAEANRVAAELQREFPVDHTGFTFLLETPRTFLFGEVRRLALALAVGAAVVLLITLVNLSQLFLIQGEARRGEFAIRAALGANRHQLARTCLVDAGVLCAIGGALGLLVAHGMVAAFNREGFLDLPTFTGVQVNLASATATAAILAAAAALFGWLPARRAQRVDLRDALQAGARSTGDRGSNLRRHLLIAAQLAFAAALLVAAVNTVRSLRALQTMPLGYEPTRVLSASYMIDRARYPDRAALRRFNEQLLASLSTLPQVGSAALWGPLAPGRAWYNITTTPSHLDPTEVPHQTMTRRLHVSPGGLATMGIALQQGADFNPAPPATGGLEGIISAKLARRFWPAGDAVGQTIFLGGNRAQAVTVVGIAADVLQNGRTYDEATAMGDIYLNALQVPSAQSTVALRFSGDAAPVIAALRESVARIDPLLALTEIVTLESRLEREAGPQQLAAAMFGRYALLALLLAGLGIYGVLAFAVAQRKREFGVRLAIGAQPAQVVTGLLRTSLPWIFGGVLAGLAIAWASAGMLQAIMVRGVAATNWPVFAGVGAAVALLGLAASLIPAWRASRTDPLVALRSE